MRSAVSAVSKSSPTNDGTLNRNRAHHERVSSGRSWWNSSILLTKRRPRSRPGSSTTTNAGRTRGWGTCGWRPGGYDRRKQVREVSRNGGVISRVATRPRRARDAGSDPSAAEREGGRPWRQTIRSVQRRHSYTWRPRTVQRSKGWIAMYAIAH